MLRLSRRRSGTVDAAATESGPRVGAALFYSSRSALVRMLAIAPSEGGKRPSADPHMWRLGHFNRSGPGCACQRAAGQKSC